MYTTTTNINNLITTTLDVEQFIKSASTIIDKYVGYKVGHNDYDAQTYLYFDGDNGKDIFLGMYIQKDFGDVTVDDVVVPVKAYPLNETYTNWLKSDNFTKGDGNIVVKDAKRGRYIVDFGQTTHTLPADIQSACESITVAMISKAQGDTVTSGVKSSETIGSYSISFDNSELYAPDSTMAKAKAILDNYKIIAIA